MEEAGTLDGLLAHDEAYKHGESPAMGRFREMFREKTRADKEKFIDILPDLQFAYAAATVEMIRRSNQRMIELIDHLLSHKNT